MVGVLFVSALLVVGQSVLAQGGSNTLLDTNNSVVVPKLQLAPDDPLLSLPSLATDTIFRLYGDSIFGSAVIYDDLFVTPSTTMKALNLGYSNIFSIPNDARLQVAGDLRVSGVSLPLADLMNEVEKPSCLCSDENGTLTRCEEYDPSEGNECGLPPTYGWNVSNWGYCLMSASGCNGTVDYTGKVDWQGEPFDWDPYFSYLNQSNIGSDPLQWMHCGGEEDPSQLPQGPSCLGYQVSAIPIGPFPTSGIIDDYMYTVIGNYWYTVDVHYAPCYGMCAGPLNGAYYSDGETMITHFTVDGTGIPAYGGGSCGSYDTQSSCNAVAGCNWSSAPTTGVQSRTVTCEDGQGTIVPDLTCLNEVGSKPATQQTCTI